MSIDTLIARADFYARANTTQAYVRYVRDHGIDPWDVMPYAGATGIIPVVDCGNGQFDFEPHLHCPDRPFDAFVCEVIDADGETTLDLVAWPVNRPYRILTMFGRAPAVGLWEAENPASYFMGKTLPLHRTPLEWLAAGCSGAAIITPRLAARWLLDLPGPVAARDHAHARQLHQIKQTLVEGIKVMVAASEERLAA
jgi:hypothetical protein